MALYPIIYNVFFHPLRKFPGPRMAGATTWWKAYKEVYQKETLARSLFDLHEKYGEIARSSLIMAFLTYYTGEIVRISPNEVSVSDDVLSILFLIFKASFWEAFCIPRHLSWNESVGQG